MQHKKKDEGVYDELRNILFDQQKNAFTIQVEWVKCKSVDWDKKTMTAIGLNDDLEFFDVLLGVGMVYTKPKPDTKCLIGMIENKASQAFLITCDQVDEILLQTTEGKLKLQIDGDTWKWNDGNNEGIVKVVPLTDDLNAIKNDINQLKQLFGSWVVVPQDGGQALKTILATWIGSQLQQSNKNNLQNSKIKH